MIFVMQIFSDNEIREMETFSLCCVCEQGILGSKCASMQPDPSFPFCSNKKKKKKIEDSEKIECEVRMRAVLTHWLHRDNKRDRKQQKL